MAAVGFRLVAVGNGSEIGLSRVDRTEVLYAPGEKAAAEVVASHVTGGAATVASSQLEAGTVALVVGPDFTTVSANPTASSVTTGGAGGSTTTTTTAPSTASTTATTVPGYEPPPMAQAARVPPEDPPPGVSCG
jgi:hypothetical protein